MDRFIVGTGRCGSTLLSRMLAEHPDVLSIFEFFTGLDAGRRFAPGRVDGPALAELLGAEQTVVTMMLRRGYDVPEIVYPFDRGRYGREGPLPWLCVTMLSRLTDDPDALFDATLAFAAARPPAPLADHYRALFAWLGERRGRGAWIERSGSSIEYLAGLHALFPRARFAHLHRDGAETALSMREHHAYRLAVSLLYGSRRFDEEEPRRGSETAGAAADPVAAILESRPDPALFGRYWSDQLVRGFRALPALDVAQYRALAFEDLLADPGPALRTLADFFELDPRPGDGWLARAAALVRGALPQRAAALADAERERLADACRPGMQLLGRAA